MLKGEDLGIERQGRIEAWIVIDTGFRTIRKRLTVALAIPRAMSMLSADTPTTCNSIAFKTQSN